MNKYTAIIVDDEEPGRKNLALLLEKYCPEIQVIGIAGNASEAKEKILTLNADVIFLNVQMPELDGFDLLNSIAKRDFAVVFVTAHEQYGREAVNAGAVYYILKPIEIKELQQAARKIVEYFDDKKQELTTETQKPQRITLSHTGGFSVIELKEIVRLQADNNYTHVHTTDKKAYLVSKPLKVFEENLKDINFFRVHRSYIINLHHVKEYLREDGGTILLADDTKIQLPKSRHADFMDAVKKLSISI